jgi:hypothetical protein
MLRNSLAAGLLACAALTPVAMAQDNKPAAQTKSNIQFIQDLRGQQFRGSDLMGQNVYNQQDETIGAIGDVLLDRNGQASGVVIDVGGFLGIGASEVAVPFNALRFEPMNDRTASATSGASGNAGSGGEQGRSAAAGSGDTSQGAPPTSGVSGPGRMEAGNQPGQANTQSGDVTASSNTQTGSAAQSAAQGQGGSADQNSGSAEASSGSSLNARIVLNTSREELENAPKFEQDEAQNQEGSSGGAGGASGGAPAK